MTLWEQFTPSEKRWTVVAALPVVVLIVSLAALYLSGYRQ